MPEIFPGKFFLYAFEKCNLVSKECMFVFHGFAGDGKTFLICNLCIVFAMLVKAGYLTPVHFAPVIGFTVKHIRVDAADSKPTVIDPAPAIFKKPARPVFIVFYPDGITGDIEYAILVTELGIWCRFECQRVDPADGGYITIEQKDVTIERPGAALRTGITPEAHVFDYPDKAFYRIFKKGMFFLGKGGNAVRDWNKRNENHQDI